MKTMGRLLAPMMMFAAALVMGGSALASSDDRASAEAALKDVEALPNKDIAAEFVAKSHAALARAAKLRAAGDEPHARLADGLALVWATAARDTLWAAAAEQQTASTRQAANDAGAQAERERALLEESIAQSGRLRAELEKVERESKEEPARTSKSANENQDARTIRLKAAPRTKTPSAKSRGTTSDGGAR